jgi:hypothetical protein
MKVTVICLSSNPPTFAAETILCEDGTRMSTERVDCIKGSKTKAQDPSDNPVAAKREKVFVDTLLDLIASGGMEGK